MRRRWPSDAIWQMHPDERTDMDWEELERCLGGIPRKLKGYSQSRLDEAVDASELGKPRVKPVKSSDQPLVQLADLFAGLAAFSWNRSNEYDRWESKENGQSDMFDRQTDILRGMPSPGISISESYKARILHRFDGQWLRHNGNGIRHDYGEGLKTWNPAIPINFWLYAPQRDDDKAPRRFENSHHHRIQR